MERGINLQRIALCLNIDDPYQKELYEFVSFLSNGKKRNASAFLKMLVDREYQKNKEQYLNQKKTFLHFEGSSKGKIIKTTNGIKFDLTKDIDQDSN